MSHLAAILDGISAPFRMQPGLRRVDAGATQITPAWPGGRHLREKLAVLGSNASQALLSVDGFDAAPALRTIAREAAAHPPVAFTTEADRSRFTARADRSPLAIEADRSPCSTEADRSPLQACAAPLLGWSLCDGDPVGEGDPAIGAVLRALEPRKRAAALVSLAFEEDFAVLEGATTVVPWLAVCLPSHWAPEAKVGRAFAEVHAPVADNATLLAAGASLARLVTGPDRWERFVWTISADPRLGQHPARAARRWLAVDDLEAPLDADGVAALASFRSERQTFIPIEGADQAVFTIHVSSVALEQAIDNADFARRVHDALVSMSPAVVAYKGLGDVRDRLLEWLARRARASCAAGRTSGA